ncbi:TIR-NBS-LRR-like protein [Parasponia andersonii]|uniref:TIR-NBS-LRR-like protein n=1 Tax=Parasponia andersonii TaxID=3476 RepID=A0A2P5ALB1_PARAD|nr:TIR-NBS-LRR-like protein [Parasponia andersonii]
MVPALPPSPIQSPNKYDVFISFRGVDTRYNFTSHLHEALLHKKLLTYMDERLERGDEISHALLKAIEDSKLSVIVFSENYASSSWCLDELVHILRCKERNRLIVVPIFYHVSPSDVRKQIGSYGVAFGTLEERFRNNVNKLNQWRAALTSAANLSGWDAPTTRYLLLTMSGNIQYLFLRSTAIEELHSSTWSLDNLVFLDLNDCKCLKNLPRSIGQLESLDHLDLGGCISIDMFPELPRNIRSLHLSGTNIKQVPSSSFECLPSLEDLYLNNCTRLETLPTSIYRLKSLVTLNLTDCSELKSFPEILEPMECLKDLYLDRTGIIKLDSSIENLIGLRWLLLRECKSLEFVPNNIYNMRRLELLGLSECPKLESLPASLGDFDFKIEVDLSYSSILKLPDWNYGLSFLPMLDPSGAIIKRRPVSIERHSNMFLSLLDKRGTSQFTIATNFLGSVRECRCWRNLSYRRFPNFSFCACSRFDVEECNNMVIDFLLTLLYEATSFVLLDGELEETIYPRINLCCPGHEMNIWFNYQCDGSSMDINLSPHWHYTNYFLGFSFCIIVEFENYSIDLNRLNYRCEYHFRTYNGESRKCSWSFQRPENVKGELEIIILSSDHMFMGYIPADYQDYCDAIEVSFEFYLEQNDWEALVNIGNSRVKKCGIRMLDLQDAHAFGIINITNDQHGEGELQLNDISNEVEPSESESMDSDTG